MPFPDRREFLSFVAGECASLAMLQPFAEAREEFTAPKNLREIVLSSAGVKVPGVAVAWLNGQQSEMFNIGTAESHRPVVDTTMFEAASLSKPTFALGVLSLVTRGMLQLDRPISEIVDLQNETDDHNVLKITPRHALTHTTGLPNWRFHTGSLRCKFAPGTRFSYSGEGIFLLQRAVEQIVGTGLAAYMRGAVLEPLGMSAASFVFEHQFKGRLAAPHDASGQTTNHRTAELGEQLLHLALERRRPLEQWTWPEMRTALPSLDPPQRPLPVFSLINAASSLLTTAHDYTKVMRAVAQHPRMTTQQVAVAPEVAWGLGVGLETGAPGLAFHWGDNDGFKAMMACDASAARGAVVLTNSDAGIPVAIRSLRSIFGYRHPSFSWVEAMYR